MESSVGSCLGICYAGNHLYYSVNNPAKDSHLNRIGSIDFNFDIEEAITTGSSDGFPAVKRALNDIKTEYNCSTVHVLMPSSNECWSIVPRAVYEDPAEREAHIRLLMNGTDRSDIEATWYSVNRTGNHLLLLRNRESILGFSHLLHSFSVVGYISDFELAIDWQTHTGNNGSFLMIHCQKNVISASSFILGKLRGCTYIEFDYAADLPYLWNLYSERLSWLRGIHDKNFIFGDFSRNTVDILSPYWHDHGDVSILSSLAEMQVEASEKTYGFRLENAFPAILMSLNKDSKPNVIDENNYG